MGLPKNIIFPVDFSDRCAVVWPAVVTMASQLRAPVTLFHALDLGPPELAFLSDERAAIRLHVRARLANFATSAASVPGVRYEIAEGQAAACIVDHAASVESPLIMMPTRGHTRFRQFLLGSVTAAVLHDALCPVWTDAHVEYKPVLAEVYRSMVCAIDMGPGTPKVLQAAREFSQRFGATLQIVHSVPGIDPRFPSGVADRAHAFLIAQAREDFLVHSQAAGIHEPLEIVEDVGMVDGLLRAALRHDADLLVIGRGVIQGSLGRLRTNAHELIRRAPCAVLSI